MSVIGKPVTINSEDKHVQHQETVKKKRKYD